MDFGPHSVHIFVSIFLVLAAAGVALAFDFLKGNNEHLRELAVELKIRKEEAERRAEAANRNPLRTAAATPVASRTARIASSAANAGLAFSRPELAREAAPSPVAARAERQQAGPERRRGREMSPAVAAVAEAAAAIVNNNREQHSAFGEQGPAFAGIAGQEASELGATVSAGSESADAGMRNMGRKNWDTILKSTRSRQGAVIPFESIREAVPAGFHDPSVLQRAVESGRIVSGLILSIGSNPLSPEGAGEVAEFLRSLAGPQDFFCQSGSDEYVLICAGEQGGSVQRRLSAIAEKLWEFQLRSIGEGSVQFSWGSAEARGERIGEAVAAAIEQMQETRQSRRVNIARAV